MFHLFVCLNCLELTVKKVFAQLKLRGLNLAKHCCLINKASIVFLRLQIHWILLKMKKVELKYRPMHSLARFVVCICWRQKIKQPVMSTHVSLACLGSGVLQLGDSLLFSSLDLSAKTKFDGYNIPLIYGKNYTC